MPIDMASGIQVFDLLAPTFKDEILTGITLQDPANPLRVVSFQSSDLDCLITSTIDNSDPLKVEVRFEKVSSCIKGILQIQVCYNFGTFSNL